MAHEKRLLIDVFQAYFYRKGQDGNRKLVFMSENLTSGGIVTSQENTDVRNGQGNGLFAILPGTKDVTVNLTENVFSFEALELNSAGKKEANIVSGGVTKNKVYKAGKLAVGAGLEAGQGTLAGAHKLIKLDSIPARIEEMSVEIGGTALTFTATAGNANTEINDNTKFGIVKDVNGTAFDGQDAAYIVIHDTAVADLATKNLQILPYVHRTAANKTSVLTIDAKEFAEGGELWLQTIEKDEKQRATAYVYFVFDNAMPEGNFEINTVSEVQPNDMTVNMRILPNENGELYRIIREEI